MHMRFNKAIRVFDSAYRLPRCAIHRINAKLLRVIESLMVILSLSERVAGMSWKLRCAHSYADSCLLCDTYAVCLLIIVHGDIWEVFEGFL